MPPNLPCGDRLLELATYGLTDLLKAPGLLDLFALGPQSRLIPGLGDLSTELWLLIGKAALLLLNGGLCEFNFLSTAGLLENLGNLWPGLWDLCEEGEVL